MKGMNRILPGDTQSRVSLDGSTVLDEGRVIEHIAQTDGSTPRRIALHAVNDLAQRIGDLVARRSTVRLVGADGTDLSSPGAGTDATTIGLPEAITIGTDDRLRADTRWAALFNVIDIRTSPSPFFKIQDAFNAITWREYKLGEKIEMGFVETSDTIYEAALYAAALQWNMLWEGWQDIWSSGDGVAAMLAKYLAFQAKTAYGIVTESSGATDVSWQLTTDDPQAARDAATINEGVRVVKSQLFNATGPDGEALEEELEGSTFYCLFDSLQQGMTERISNALEARYQAGDGELTEVKYNVTPLGSPHIDGGPYIVLPGRKIVLGLSRDMTMYDVQDPRIAGVAEGSVGQSAWRMVRGDSNQVAELAFS